MNQNPARNVANPSISSPQAARAFAFVPPMNFHPASEITEYSSNKGMTISRRHSRLVTVARITIFLVAGLNESDISQSSSSARTADRAIVEEKAMDDIRLEMRFSFASEYLEPSRRREAGEQAEWLRLSLVDEANRG